MGSVLGCRDDTFESPIGKNPSESNLELVGNPNMNKDLDRAVNMVTDSVRLSSSILLRFSCEKLPNMDYFSLTDAFLMLSELKKGQWVEVGRTEVVKDCLEP